jgi:hypothetical protein
VDCWAHGLEHLPRQLRHTGGEQPQHTRSSGDLLLLLLLLLLLDS